jgi:pimeloyl-ACP methyl ester carboxylesterase
MPEPRVDGIRLVNGVRLYYEEHGEGRPIACIHGTGGSAQVWGDALGQLAPAPR